MNRLQPTRFYVGMLLFFIATLTAGVLIFLLGMSDSSYLINDGVHYLQQTINVPRYEDNLQGLIFALAFLVAGLLMLLMVMLPDALQSQLQVVAGGPAPRRRAAAPATSAPTQQAAPQPAPQTAPTRPTPTAPHQPEPELEPEALAEPEPGAAPAASAPPPPAPVAPAAPVEPLRSLEEEIQASPDLPDLDGDNSRFDDNGEEDVVYGTGRVTDDSAWSFVQTYPDSAVKFLYRRTLDNKALSAAEEEIYRRWELRGLTRAKVRDIVLDIMGWQSLPDDLPHNIWRELRDQVFEMQN